MKRQGLLISGDSELTQTVLNLLDESPFNVSQVGNLHEAARLLRIGGPFKLLIVDLALEDDRLIDLIEKVRHHKQMREMPIIAIADLDSPDVLRAALKAGTSRYITRGFLEGNLRETIRDLESLTTW